MRLVDLGPIIENLGVRARSQRRASLARIVSITASSFDKVMCRSDLRQVSGPKVKSRDAGHHEDFLNLILDCLQALHVLRY